MDTMSDMPGMPGLFVAGNIFTLKQIDQLASLTTHLREREKKKKLGEGRFPET